MDLAHADKLAKVNNGLKYVLVRQDRFDRIVDAKGMKTKNSNGTVRAFLSMITKKNRPGKVWVDKGREFVGEFRKICKAEIKQIHSKMSEIKASFAERTLLSLENIHYRYMEDNGYKYIHNLTQFVTTLNSRRNCSTDLIPKNVKKSDILSILYSKPKREFRRPKFEIGDKIRISKYDLLFKKGWKPQFTKEVFEIVASSSRKPQTYTKKNEHDKIIRGKLYQKELMKDVMHGQWEVATWETSYPSRYQSATDEKFLFYDKKLSKSSYFYYLEPGPYPSITDIVEAKKILIQECQDHGKN